MSVQLKVIFSISKYNLRIIMMLLTIMYKEIQDISEQFY